MNNVMLLCSENYFVFSDTVCDVLTKLYRMINTTYTIPNICFEVTTRNWCDRKYWFTCEQFSWEETLNNDDASGGLYEMCKFSYLHKCRYPLKCIFLYRHVHVVRKKHIIRHNLLKTIRTVFRLSFRHATVKYFALWPTISQLQAVLILCIYV